MLAQQVFVEAGVVVFAVGEGPGGELFEVVVADVVFGEQHQVVAFANAAVLVGDVAGHLGDVGLHAHDGLDAGLGGLLVEVDGAVHVAVVGDGHRLHPQLAGALDEVLHPDRAVEERVLRVQMQVGKVGAAHAASIGADDRLGSEDPRNASATAQASRCRRPGP